MRQGSAVALLAILMAACSSQPPAGSEIGIVSATPASVEVFGRSPIPGAIGSEIPWVTDQIADLAQSHCAKYGKDARKLSQRDVPGARYVLFDCVPSTSTEPLPESI